MHTRRMKRGRAPPMPIPAPTPAIPGELTRLSGPEESEAETDRSCAVCLNAASEIVRAPAGGVVAGALEGGRGTVCEEREPC